MHVLEISDRHFSRYSDGNSTVNINVVNILSVIKD